MGTKGREIARIVLPGFVWSTTRLKIIYIPSEFQDHTAA